MKNVLLSWSSGKDSAWALHLLSQQSDLRVAGLVTTFNRITDRVAMHDVRRTLVQAQAERAAIPLWEVDLPWPCSNAEYEGIMRGVMKDALDKGVEAVVFGDLFLQDIRDYRERQLAGTGLEALFPVWGTRTRQLALDMIAGGIKAKLTCVDPAKLNRSYAGRDFDMQFLESLPEEVDPCGENGEFHTFVYAAPFFDRPMEVQLGSIVERDGFVFADIVSDGDSAPGR